MTDIETCRSADQATANSDPIIAALRRPTAYTESTRHVSVRETHISWIFLTDHHAYKLKKPVKFAFLDFSTPERRREACQNELTLNRRLSPQVYLDVVPLTRSTGGNYVVDGTSEPVDWLVKMRRLPDDRALDHLISTTDVGDQHIGQIADKLVDFYSQLPPLSMHTERYREHLEKHIRDNYEELRKAEHALSPNAVRRLYSAQIRALRLYPGVFDDRVRDGRIVEGHGDLRPEHIYLAPTPKIIDCIEFDPELRQLDVLDELSFLAMECEALGAKSIGGRILSEYCRRCDDQPEPFLLPFYLSYRASVRCKVSALRALQLPEEQRADAQQTTQQYLQLADHYAAELGPPWLIIVRGVSGSGKLTLTRALAESLGCHLLQTDAVRQQLLAGTEYKRADVTGNGDAIAAYGRREYSSAMRRRVYERMFEEAEAILSEGLSVVLDGTFLTTKLRMQAMLVARRFEAQPLLLECRCPVELAEQRIAERQSRTDSDSASDAVPEFVAIQESQQEADPAGMASVPVDTTAVPSVMLAQIFKQMAELR